MSKLLPDDRRCPQAAGTGHRGADPRSADRRHLAPSEEVDQHLDNVEDRVDADGVRVGTVAAGPLDLATSPMISAWGQRPG